MCDECEHFDRFARIEASNVVNFKPCLLGHKPRFVMPNQGATNKWGFQRNCEDFHVCSRACAYCSRTDPHIHCTECGATDHVASECKLED